MTLVATCLAVPDPFAQTGFYKLSLLRISYKWSQMRPFWQSRLYELLQKRKQMIATWNLFMSFCTIFSYLILGWYHDNLGWKYFLLFSTEKKKLFWTNKKFLYLIFINKLPWYHSEIKYENIVQKDMNNFFIVKLGSAGLIKRYTNHNGVTTFLL
jgi:hypothetical protein